MSSVVQVKVDDFAQNSARSSDKFCKNRRLEIFIPLISLHRIQALIAARSSVF